MSLLRGAVDVNGELTALIAPLGAAGRAEEITLRISQAIQLGLLADEERLPSESEFAEQFGVSPVTLREAIATLRERGLIETRRGRLGGSFVRRIAEPDESLDLARLRSLSATSLRDMCDEHAAIAGHSARLAAERANSSSLRRIHVMADQLSAATTRRDRVKADSRFHIEVAIATLSERLTRREVALQGDIVGLLWTSHLSQPEMKDIDAEHQAIAKAVAAEDGPTAGSMAEEHVRNNLRRLTTTHRALTSSTRRPA